MIEIVVLQRQRLTALRTGERVSFTRGQDVYAFASSTKTRRRTTICIALGYRTVPVTVIGEHDRHGVRPESAD